MVEAVRAAVERLTADGTSFTELRVERIAKEAGIARSTFYLRFQDKTTLLCTLATAVGHDVFAEVDDWLTAGGSGEDALARLSATTATILTRWRHNRAVLLAVREVAAYSPEVRQVWDTALTRLAKAGGRRLRQDQQKDRTPAGSAERTTEIAAVMILESVARHLRIAPAHDDAEFSATLARAIWAVWSAYPR
jgi:TetR/AcrR family transcriptional regulator, ethionamide resistance regulator